MPRYLVVPVLLVLACLAADAFGGVTSDPRLAELRLAVEQDPGDADARRALAIALHESGRTDEALTQFEWLAEHTPSVRTLLDLALAYGSGTRWDDSEATYRRILEISPNHPVALHNLGNTEWKRGNTDQAIHYYVLAIKAKPDYLLAYAHLGDALTQAERYREAYRAYEGALEFEPKSAAEADAYFDALYNMAALDLKMGEYERAGMLLAELIRADPQHPKAYHAYGQVLLFLGRTDDAQKALAEHQRIQAMQKPSGPMAHGD